MPEQYLLLDHNVVPLVVLNQLVEMEEWLRELYCKSLQCWQKSTNINAGIGCSGSISIRPWSGCISDAFPVKKTYCKYLATLFNKINFVLNHFLWGTNIHNLLPGFCIGCKNFSGNIEVILTISRLIPILSKSFVVQFWCFISCCWCSILMKHDKEILPCLRCCWGKCWKC